MLPIGQGVQLWSEKWLTPEPDFRLHVGLGMAHFEVADRLIDAAALDSVAREMVDLHGADAVHMLRDRACIAAGLGDQLSVNAWLDIAEAVQDLLQQRAATLPSSEGHKVRAG
jgi:hypothetical protein